MIPCRTFIYALCDPDKETCRYVGKADDPQRRYRNHLRLSLRVESTEYATHVGRWIRKLRLAGKRPMLRILEWVFQSKWKEYEQWWIRFFNLCRCPMTNVSTGGFDGGGRVRLGVRNSTEHRNKISLSRRGRSFGPRGPFSEEARNKIREGLKRAGVKPPPHAYEKALLANKGRIAWNRGKEMSPETCAKLSAMRIGNPSRTGMKDRPETLERKRQAQVRRWSDPKQRELAADASRKMWEKRRKGES